MDNNLVLTEQNASAAALRVFLRLAPSDGGTQQANKLGAGVTVEPGAVVLNCKIGAGKIGAKAVLCNVSAPSVDVDSSVLMNVTSATPIVGRGGMLYNVVHEASEGELLCKDVRADVFLPGGEQHKMHSTLETDGGKAWKLQVNGNPMSFEGIYKTNSKLDVRRCSISA